MSPLINQQAPAERCPDSQARASAGHQPVLRTLLLWLTLGGASAALFTVVYLIEGVTRPRYDAMSQAISALALGPGGWLQQANFIVFGACLLGVAVAWRATLRGSAGAVVYPVIRGVEGVAFIAVGLFSDDPTRGYPPGATLTPTTFHGEIHIIGAYVIVSSMALGLCVMAWRFARELHWWGWATFSVVGAILTLFFMALFGMAQGGGAGVAYAGLYERLATNSETVWTLALIIAMWAGARFMRYEAAAQRG